MRKTLLPCCLVIQLVSLSGCWERRCYYGPDGEPLCSNDSTDQSSSPNLQCNFVETAFITNGVVGFGSSVSASDKFISVNSAGNSNNIYLYQNKTLTQYTTTSAYPGFALSGGYFYRSVPGSPSKDVACTNLNASPQPADCAPTAKWPEPITMDTNSSYYGRSIAAVGTRFLISDPDDGSIFQGQFYSGDQSSAVLTKRRSADMTGMGWGSAIALSANWAAAAKSQEVRFSSDLSTWQKVSISGCAFVDINDFTIKPEQSLSIGGDVLLAAVTCVGGPEVRDFLLGATAQELSDFRPLADDLHRSSRLALAQSDSVAVIGAPATGGGSAWALTRDGVTHQVDLRTRLVPSLQSSPAPSGSYGASVAATGSYVVVGDPGAMGGTGAIHVFACVN